MDILHFTSYKVDKLVSGECSLLITCSVHLTADLIKLISCFSLRFLTSHQFTALEHTHILTATQTPTLRHTISLKVIDIFESCL